MFIWPVRDDRPPVVARFIAAGYQLQQEVVLIATAPDLLTPAALNPNIVIRPFTDADWPALDGDGRAR